MSLTKLELFFVVGNMCSDMDALSKLLDDHVHDAASVLGSKANNDGPIGQIEFLLAHGWSPDDIYKVIKSGTPDLEKL